MTEASEDADEDEVPGRNVQSVLWFHAQYRHCHVY